MTEPTAETSREVHATAQPPWTPASRPRLPSKVRLQWDDAREQAMLLFPEGVLMLNPTAHAVLKLVDGRRSVGEIVGELARSFDPSAASRTEAEEVELSMDPGTDTGEHHEVSGADAAGAAGVPGGASEGAAPPATSGEGLAAGVPNAAESPRAQREAVIERDVMGFLKSLESRGWLYREPPPE